jgi:hypothetical protein
MIDKLIRYTSLPRFIGDDPATRILEVGAGPHGMGCCLPYRFVGVDTWYPERPVPNQQAVRASATQLPFPDKSFDVVLCIEVLEHLSEDERPGVVAEMCRVARRRIIITHPWGRLAKWDDHVLGVLYDMLRVVGQSRPWWLVEHLKNPYPNPKLYLSGQEGNFSVRERGEENALLHPGLVFFGTLRIVSRATNKLYERWPKLLTRIVRLVNFPPFSRRMIILDRKPDDKS